MASAAPPGGSRARSRAHVALAALVLTLANAGKPLVVDDTAYTYFARQILEDPSDPYGFSIHWYQAPEPAFGVLAPPVLPYWLAGAMALVGDDPLRWKLALFPFALALAAALRSLLARFAPGLEIPLLWMAILSPAILPFFNLMLDVPALALSLLALAVFLAACDRDRLGGAVGAGFALGFAMQTKYTAVTGLVAMLAFGFLASRWRQALVAVGCAALVFAGWEGLMAARYGRSHFVQALIVLGPQFYGAPGAELVFAKGFLVLLGALGPAVGLLGLAALGASTQVLAAATLAVAAGFAAIPLWPGLPAGETDDWPYAGAAPPEGLLFLAFGLVTAASVLAVVLRQLRRGPDRRDLFLVAWLAIEVAAFAELSPFLAARRIFGVALVAFLVCGRALAGSLGGAPARARLRLPVALGAAIGVLFAASDWADAATERAAVGAAAARLRELGADPGREGIWFVGHWGFQFYAERGGMRPLAPGLSRLEPGDWILVPDGVTAQGILARRQDVAVASDPVELRSVSPWSTLPWSYTGPIPIRPRSDVRLRLQIFRALRAFVPGAGPAM